MTVKNNRKQKVVYKNPWTTVYEDNFVLPNGENGIYGFTDRPDGAIVLVVDPNECVLLMQQYRYPVDCLQWELPGGGIDEGEDPEDAARREIKEETGISILSLEKIGEFYPLNSLSTEKGILFVARLESTVDVSALGENDEEFEDAAFFSKEEVYRMIDEGEVQESYTANALQLFFRKYSKVI